jgi:hypothetical protein
MEESHMKSFLFNLATCVCVLAGCASRHSLPDLAVLYNRSAQHHDEKRNPIILIPGILGSKLIDSGTGQIVWGAFTGGYADPRTREGARLIALPMGEDVPLDQLRDSVVSDGALESLKVEVASLPFEIGAYVHVMEALGIGGYRDEQLGSSGAIDYGEEHFTCFQFDYDWRRDNVESAKLLHEFLLEKRAYVQAEYEKRYGVTNFDVKFDIVTHSMGGLVLRYYLRYGPIDLPAADKTPRPTWAGAQYVDRAIFVGPPNAGSVSAFVQLLQGRKFGPTLPRYEPVLLGTMPAVYQLLPRGRHGPLVDATNPEQHIENILNPKLWEEMGWGMAASGQDRGLERLLPEVTRPADRYRIALDHQRKCLTRARRFQAALDIPSSPPDGLTLHLIAGDALPTPAVVSVNMRNGKIGIFREGPGDGTVLRSSALMDERLIGAWSPTLVSPITWDQVLFLFSGHLEMTRDPAFTDNLLFLLLEHPRGRFANK